jgi:hypothetical protein
MIFVRLRYVTALVSQRILSPSNVTVICVMVVGEGGLVECSAVLDTPIAPPCWYLVCPISRYPLSP